MNESFIHHVLRVALILGIIAGLAGFAVLLYAADFWSSPVRQNPDTSAAVASESPPLEASRDFGERTVIWMFGEPDSVPASEPASAPVEAPAVETVLEPAGDMPVGEVGPAPVELPQSKPTPAPQFELRP